MKEMKKQQIAFLLLSFIMSNTSWAQDIHWSQFLENPIFQNPGQAGNFNGDYRFVANYRDQWRSVSVPFQTTSFSFDGKTKVKNRSEIGYGFLVFHDVVGDGKLQTLELQANTNVSFQLKSDSSLVLRTGINLGMNQRRLNANALFFDNQFDGVKFNPNLPSNELFQTDSKTNFSGGLGAVLDYRISKSDKINAGVGFYNLNRPNQGFFGQKITRDIRSNLFINYAHVLSSQLILKPALHINVQGKYRETIMGSSIQYILNNQKTIYRAIQGGVWYRLKDAAYFTAGMNYQDWFFGVSYDLNFSKLTQASGARGGIEFAVQYIIRSVKPKKIVHRVCPDYI